MQTNRKKSRKLLFQILYSKIFNKYIEDDFIDSFNSLIYDFDMDQVYIKSNMNMIKEYESFFIHIINKYSKKFKIEQINKIYIIPIYISLSELFYIEEEIPLKVSINEATEIAKIYWWETAGKFVNWLLHNIKVDYDDLYKIKSDTYWDNQYSIFKK